MVGIGGRLEAGGTKKGEDCCKIGSGPFLCAGAMFQGASNRSTMYPSTMALATIVNVTMTPHLIQLTGLFVIASLPGSAVLRLVGEIERLDGAP